MENNVFKVVLLQALPASGKSEVRNFMANIEPERLKKEFHIGENLQLDDFPYVHMMRRIDNELEAMGQARLFYPGEEPFIDGRDWGTLCCLLNEDYHDPVGRKPVLARRRVRRQGRSVRALRGTCRKGFAAEADTQLHSLRADGPCREYRCVCHRHAHGLQACPAELCRRHQHRLQHTHQSIERLYFDANWIAGRRLFQELQFVLYCAVYS